MLFIMGSGRVRPLLGKEKTSAPQAKAGDGVSPQPSFLLVLSVMESGSYSVSGSASGIQMLIPQAILTLELEMVATKSRHEQRQLH